MADQFDLGQQFLQLLLVDLLMVLLPVGLFGWMGYSSLRFLRGLPDFEHKEEMEWGARWGWAIVAGLFTTWPLVKYLGITFTPYDLTFFFGGGLFLALGFCALYYFLPWQNAGLDIAGAAQRGRWRKQPFNLEAWLERKRRGLRKWRIVTAALGLMVTAFSVRAIAKYTYPLDREFLMYRQLDQLGASLQEQLNVPELDQVIVIGPPTFQHYRLVIKVKEEIGPERAEELLTLARSALAEMNRRERWGIMIRGPQRGETLIKDYYEPSSHATEP